jgi:single-stranded-DNA-specific exonuclease
MLSFSDITTNFFHELNRFQPFGPGNNLPIFASEGCVKNGEPKLVGIDAEHLRRDLKQTSAPLSSMQTIAFQQPSHYEWVHSGRPIDICYQIVENNYRGKASLQLRIKDIKRCQ